MRTFEIILPQRDNAGEAQPGRITEWLGEALAKAGGFTILTDDARGAWQASDTQTMLDNSSVIRVATTPAIWRTLIRAFWRAFPDQRSVFWTDIGEGVIELRPSRLATDWLRDGAHEVRGEA